MIAGPGHDTLVSNNGILPDVNRTIGAKGRIKDHGVLIFKIVFNVLLITRVDKGIDHRYKHLEVAQNTLLNCK